MSSPITRCVMRTPLNNIRQAFTTQLILTAGLAGLALLLFLPVLTRVVADSRPAIKVSDQDLQVTRLSENVSVRAAGRGNPSINLSQGREVLTHYVGPEELRQALAQNQAQPLSLASADFDEDGVPDLLSGYAYQGRGLISLMRGNVDSIYPNAPEGKQDKANGTFTEAPFLSPARIFGAPLAAEFVGAGDFDGDSHWDVVVASRTAKVLYLLSGDGRGGFGDAREIVLPGVVTAMTTGEINRADGLNDLVIGVAGEHGSQLLVFEGPEGALRAKPEVFELRMAATSLALGQLDSQYPIDLAIAAGNELLVVNGRDRKLSLDESLRAKVPDALISRRLFDSPIRSIAIGHFTISDEQSIAVLGNDGGVQLLSPGKAARRTLGAGRGISAWLSNEFSSGAWSQAQLVSAHVSSSAYDDVLVIDAADRQVHILNRATADSASSSVSAPTRLAASLAATTAPVAVLPMRLNGDALSDLMVLSSGQSSPALVPTQATSTFVVTNTNASGAGSLQFAILDANESPGADIIAFNIPGSGTQTISPTAALPTITDPVTIDGTTQPGYAGTPVIVLNGASAGPSAVGLTLQGGNSIVRGLHLLRFSGGEISLRSNNNLIEGNFLFNPAQIGSNGTVSSQGSAQANTIGGTTTAARNVTNINLRQGATNNKIQGNFLGTDATGTGLGGGVGVAFGAAILNGGTSNLVGGTVAGSRNIISSIQSYGMSNLIQGNYVGTDVTGLNSLGGSGGITLHDSLNTIGGTTPATRNVISGNVAILALGCLVQGNYIGVDVNGQGHIGSSVQGVFVQDAPDSIPSAGNNTIGGVVAGAGNVIANSTLSCIEISGGQGGHLVQGNRIGTDASGVLDLGSVQNGVYIHNSPNNIVGGTDPAARNIISGNGLSGVLIEGAQATGNVVLGNFIGTNAAGTAALGNDLNGVTTSQAPNNIIGGSVVEARNIISANARHGVSIGIDTNSGATGITVQNNYIGTDVTGNNCLGNQRDGVFVNRGSVSHTISDNLITCNARNGVNIPNFVTNDAGIRIQVTNNFIYANANLGIDLGDAGITQNDSGDADTGANFLQNFPVLSSFAPATPSGQLLAGKEWFDLPGAEASLKPETLFTVNSQLNSTPNTTFTVHWYFSADAQCVTNQQASRPLAYGRVPGVTTNGNGDATFSFGFEFPAGMSSGIINATATDPNGNTSEFSSCLAVSGPAPTTTMQFSAAGYSVNEGAGSVAVTVTRSGNTAGASNVDFAVSDGSAKQSQDYVINSGTLNFGAGETSKMFSVLIVDDAHVESNEVINLTLSNAIGGALAVPGTATLTITDNDSSASTSPAAKRFGAILDGGQETPANNSSGKGTGYLLLNAGETSALVGVQFQNLGSAEVSAHIHNGAPGVAGPILFTLAPPIVNPIVNMSISPTAQQVIDLKAGLHYFNVHSTNFTNGEIRGQLRWNPTLEENFFVRQQYLDFLSRDGDPSGFNFWVGTVSCQADAQCWHDRTIITSNAFFFEPEFQQTAGYVFRGYRAAFGNNQPFPNPDGSNATEANKLIDYSAFVADRARVVGGADLAAAQLAFANQFVLRSQFTTRYGAGLNTAALFVDAILTNIQTADGVNLAAQRQILIDQYTNAGGGNAGRGQVLYRIADDNAQNPFNNQAFINAEYNRQFALTLYFGYLRRNPDIGGFLFWQSQINAAPIRDVPKQNALVCSFLTAAEYQFRFGSNAPRSNAECPQ